MNVKTKIRLGLLFLLAIIILLAGAGSYYINRLADESKDIVKDNYNTLQYTKNMIQALDEKDFDSGVKKFELNLIMQEHNITEIGETEATAEMRQVFEKYKSGSNNDSTQSELRAKILHVQDLNMEAITKKNEGITRKTRTAFAYITMLGTLCFLLSFTFVINFPRWIAGPIAALTEGIRNISNKDYSTRIRIDTKDEFGELADAFNKMAGELDAWQHSNLNQLIFEKKRIETIINNMKDAIIGFDEHNKILFANSIAIQLLGVIEKDMIGKYAPDVALRNDLLRNLLTKDQAEKLLKIFADNKESYFSKEYLEIFNKEEKIGEVIVLRNITQFQELDLAKTNFIATISHELKTPLSSMQMSVKLLEDERIGTLNEEQQKLLANIKGDRDRLLKITGELLDMTQVESGNIQLNTQKVQPHKIVEQAINTIQQLAQQKNIQIEKRISENIHDVKADADKTSWVLLNFLTNAIRYSPQNSKVIVSVEQKGNAIEFSVKDYGKGIEEKYLGKVFDKFFQVPGSSPTGSGMGLAISKEIIEKQGGKIHVESELGKGSRFIFQLKA